MSRADWASDEEVARLSRMARETSAFYKGLLVALGASSGLTHAPSVRSDEFWGKADDGVAKSVEYRFEEQT